MGVLNVTPDSFSDGGKFLGVRDAVKQALAMEKAGAQLIDIGAESTRPGSLETTAEEELRRLLPVLKALSGRLRIPISVDTRKAAVAEAALQAGAEIINDVSGLRHDAALARVVAKHKVPLTLMHMRGEPRTMQRAGFARDVLTDVARGLRKSIAIARAHGVAKAEILLDPGIGFGKSWPQNYELLAKLEELAKLGYPLVVGTSRNGGDRGRQHPARRAHRTCARCGRDGASSARYRLCVAAGIVAKELTSIAQSFTPVVRYNAVARISAIVPKGFYFMTMHVAAPAGAALFAILLFSIPLSAQLPRVTSDPLHPTQMIQGGACSATEVSSCAEAAEMVRSSPNDTIPRQYFSALIGDIS